MCCLGAPCPMGPGAAVSQSAGPGVLGAGHGAGDSWQDLRGAKLARNLHRDPEAKLWRPLRTRACGDARGTGGLWRDSSALSTWQEVSLLLPSLGQEREKLMTGDLCPFCPGEGRLGSMLRLT